MISLLFRWNRKPKSEPKRAASEPAPALSGASAGAHPVFRENRRPALLPEPALLPKAATSAVPTPSPAQAGLSPKPAAPDQSRVTIPDRAARAMAPERAIQDLASPDGFDPAIMRKGFENLSPNARKHVQKLLAQMGLHPVQTDGSWLPDTNRGAARLASLIAARSDGNIRFDLKSRGDVTRLFTGLRDGTFADILNSQVRV